MRGAMPVRIGAGGGALEAPVPALAVGAHVPGLGEACARPSSIEAATAAAAMDANPVVEEIEEVAERG